MLKDENITIVKPILKWVGGKTQIINQIMAKFPKEMENYHELFLGGGSVLFALLSYQKKSKIVIKNNIYAYDLNKGLINLYKIIQSKHVELYKEIIDIKKLYDSCDGCIINRKPRDINDALTSKESYYYWIRYKYNIIEDINSIESSAMFLFLNKTCFRGMFRESKNGFNVPYGHYKNPTIVELKGITEVHELIQGVIFEHSDFSIPFKYIKKNDFVYLDPPYAPENNKSFVSYTNEGFNIEQHKKLFSLTNNLTNFLMSNSNVELINQYFPKNKH